MKITLLFQVTIRIPISGQYPTGYQISGQISDQITYIWSKIRTDTHIWPLSDWIPDIWPNIQPNNRYLAEHPTWYRISGQIFDQILDIRPLISVFPYVRPAIEIDIRQDTGYKGAITNCYMMKTCYPLPELRSRLEINSIRIRRSGKKRIRIRPNKISHLIFSSKYKLSIKILTSY